MSRKEILLKHMEELGRKLIESGLPGRSELICDFRNGKHTWQLYYRHPRQQDHPAELVFKKRSAEHVIVLDHTPEALLDWWNCLGDVLTQSDRQGVGFVMRWRLRLIGRKILCCRSMRGPARFSMGLLPLKHRYNIARLTGWFHEIIVIAFTSNWSPHSESGSSPGYTILTRSSCEQLLERWDRWMTRRREAQDQPDSAPIPTGADPSFPPITGRQYTALGFVIVIVVILITALLLWTLGGLFPLIGRLFHR